MKWLVDWDATFFRGAKSDMEPSQLPLGYYWTGMNLLNLGGVLSTRPGYKCIQKLPVGRLQGATLFRPILGLEQIIIAIDGKLYVTTFPFEDLKQIPNITLAPNAKQVFWAHTTQAAQRDTAGLNSSISLIAPKSVLLVQDGGNSAPAWYDGSNSGQISGNALDTPAGGPMAWVGDRLWVARDNTLFASDISNPFSFREKVYLGGNEAFFFDGEITALAVTPSIESPQLFVFTSRNGSIVQANIRDRTQWSITEDFQSEVVQVGCLAHRSAVSHYGHLVWFSQSGVAIFDPATSGKLTARLPVRDNEMLISKARIDTDVSQVAAGVFGQYLMMSVPAEDIYNKHTWVMNNASLATLADDSGPSWAGMWTGTRPVEWVYGEMGGVERALYVSVDTDGNNRLWEAFQKEQLDNGCPITWAVETRSHFGMSAPSQQKNPGERCRLSWLDVALAGVSEDLDLGVFFAPGCRGQYRPMMTKRILVAQGSLDNTQQITADSQVFAFKPQSRVLRTEDANSQPANPPSGNCGVERADIDNIDDSFQFLIVGHGPATIRWIRSFAQSYVEDQSGDGTACQDETGINAVRFDGVAAIGATLDAVIAELASINTQDFLSNQTQVLHSGDFSAVGVGSAESIVSQEAADRVAQIIATKQAEMELSAIVPPTLSVGLGL
jgi:hypothetical protein